MANQTNAAYDLSLFENRKARQLRVIENHNRKKIRRQKHFRAMRVVLVAALVLGLIASVLTSNNVVTQLSADIDAAQTELDRTLAEEDYLQDQLSSTHNLTEVENFAEQMGLAKMHNNEIYFTLETENQIEVQKSNAKTAVEGLAGGFMNLMEYLLP